MDEKMQRAKAELAAMDKMLDVLDPLDDAARKRALAAAAIMSGLVSPDVVLRELDRTGGETAQGAC
jgi:hypothetical protein